MVYKIVKSDELYHHGVKGMKWGVRKEKVQERREKRELRKLEKLDAKEAKKEYKQEKKNIREDSNKIFKEYVDTQKASAKAYTDYKKFQKAELKGKSIDKDTYKKNVRKAKDNMRQINNRAEVKMAVGQYHIQKRRHANDMVYAIDTRNSKAYEKGKKAFYRDTEYTAWGNSTYRITKRKDGTYNIGRTDYYYY